MSLTRNVLKVRGIKLSQIFISQCRRFRTSPCLVSDAKSVKAYQTLKLKQAKMQVEHDVPIYLRCGLRDKILFNVTVGLMLCNFILSARTIRDLYKS